MTSDPITPGTIYKLKYRAVNKYGNSDWSEELNVGFSSLPVKPNPLRQVIQESNETQITLEWDSCLDTELPVLGYKLLINDGIGGDVYTEMVSIIYPNVRKYQI